MTSSILDHSLMDTQATTPDPVHQHTLFHRKHFEPTSDQLGRGHERDLVRIALPTFQEELDGFLLEAHSCNTATYITPDSLRIVDQECVRLRTQKTADTMIEA